MYLLAFVLLFVAMLGVYTQVFAIETARLFASQTGIAQTMMAWHSAAVSLAQTMVVAPGPGASCSLSSSLTNSCAPSALNFVGATPAGITVTDGATANSYTYLDLASVAHTYPHLPANYNAAIYQWYSIAFQEAAPNNTYYVVTYAKHGTGTPGFLSTASGAQLGITASDLMHQFRHTDIPPLAYGYVSNPTGGSATMVTAANSGGATPLPIAYIVPPSIPDGAFAIISSPNPPCTGC